MSATNRALHKRNEYDAYNTPVWCAEAIVRQIAWGNIPRIWEPAVGEGAILNVVKEMVECQYHGSDIRPNTGWIQEDFLEVNPVLRLRTFDFIITNPPFSLAQGFVEKSLSLANCTIMLLRLNFLASKSRKEFWEKHPPTAIHVLTKRPSFTGKGTDATDYAWFVWDTTGRQKKGIYWL